jgi:hypothetical protein
MLRSITSPPSEVVGADFRALRAARAEGVVDESALVYAESRVERVLSVVRT